MYYYHVDVFSSLALSGNGLTVIFHEEEMEAEYMQRIAQEFKQFETIFLRITGKKRFRARIFTVEEELDFAGHPILGAVSSIHKKLHSEENSITVTFELNTKTLQAESIKTNNYFQATMNQGVPNFLGIVKNEWIHNLLQSLNLTSDNLYHALPMEVVSTGLPYLIVPLASGLEQAKVSVNNFEVQLSKINAKFVYVFDVDNLEGRTWDNLGAVEDVATGSAGGSVGAYLYKWKSYKETEDIIISQGRFVGRPSKMKVFSNQSTGEIIVAGDVKIVAEGTLLL